MTSDGRVRVLHLIDSLGLGGAERLLLSVAGALDPARFDLRIVSLADDLAALDGVPAAGRVSISSLGLRPRWTDLRAPGCIARLIRAERPAIVHTHLAHSDAWGLLAATLTGVPVRLSTQHNTDPWKVSRRPQDRLKRAVETPLLRRASAVVAVSAEVRELVISRQKLRPERVVALPNAIETAFFRRPESTWTAAERADADEIGRTIPHAAFVFGCVARLTAQKAHHRLIDAFAAVSAALPESRLVLVGGGEAEPDLRAQTARLGLMDRVWFAGSRGSATPWLHRFDVAVVASDHEGGPLTAIEALAAGLSLISTDVGIIPTLIEHGRSGWVVAPGDTTGLAERMRWVAEHPAERAEVAAWGQRRAAAFDIAAYAAKLAAIYENLLDGRLPGSGLAS